MVGVALGRHHHFRLVHAGFRPLLHGYLAIRGDGYLLAARDFPVGKRSDGTCYACGGTGRRPTPKIVKVYTPEHLEKLEARRAAKAQKPEAVEKARAMMDEMRTNGWKRLGFTADGLGYLHTGNTYRNMDKLKAAGGRWNPILKGYIVPTKVELKSVTVTEIHAQECCTPAGYIDRDKAWELCEKLQT